MLILPHEVSFSENSLRAALSAKSVVQMQLYRLFGLLLYRVF